MSVPHFSVLPQVSGADAQAVPARLAHAHRGHRAGSRAGTADQAGEPTGRVRDRACLHSRVQGVFRGEPGPVSETPGNAVRVHSSPARKTGSFDRKYRAISGDYATSILMKPRLAIIGCGGMARTCQRRPYVRHLRSRRRFRSGGGTASRDEEGRHGHPDLHGHRRDACEGKAATGRRRHHRQRRREAEPRGPAPAPTCCARNRSPSASPRPTRSSRRRAGSTA